MMSKKATSKDLLIHLGIVLGAFIAIAYLFFFVWLPYSTNHGETIEVPNFNSKTIVESAEMANIAKVKLQIFDSSYAPDFKARTVISQFPKAGDFVKSNRTIYVSISTKFPPKIKMPKLIGNSEKAAEITLKSYGLKLGHTSYVYGVHEGEVLRQLSNTNTIQPGTYIEKGTTIDLVVSSGLSNEQVVLPNLVGMDYETAQDLLKKLGLDVGSIVYDSNSSMVVGTVLKQKPENIQSDSTIKIRVGEIVDVWVSGEDN
ncbi:MAG: PASTA domain-containing protein [Cytophagales bacterium]